MDMITMGDSTSSTLVSLLGALQASLAVLLTISYGVIAARWNLLSDSSARDISKTCVRLFLPALLITNVGSQLHADTAIRYVPVLIWALVYTLLSMALGYLLKKMFKLPAWTVPAICFNNTTALPLLLVQSLSSAGILDTLLKDDDDTTSAAVKRAKSYFLVSAVVGNALTFTMGPRLLDDEESPDASAETNKNNDCDNEEGERTATDEDGGSLDEDGNERPDEETTLLPRPLDTQVLDTIAKAAFYTNKWLSWLPERAQKTLSVMTEFVNAPLVGAAIGAFLGLIPGLHKLFFSEPDEGGVFKAWLTQSVENIGDLFASLQLVVVGSKLATSLMKAKRGEDSGKVEWKSMALIFFIRFLLWPALSISTIYFLAAKTNLLDNDPILWFVMMLMPTGPPATKLTALADVSGAKEKHKLAISKFLTLSYAASPVICVAVVGSLKAVGAVGEAKA